MSKATWAYRLPTPHPMRPATFPFAGRKSGDAPSKWHASHMDNYEHIRGGMVRMAAPGSNKMIKGLALGKLQAEVQAGRPLWALDSIQQMYKERHIPEQEHWREVLIGAAQWGEEETARDCWALMERQRFIPDDQTLCCWFEVCARMKFKDLALQAWNRYCTEFAFLEAGEMDPKPVMREKHTLTRDDIYNLPWWKKRWSYDPCLDVPDAHRFNRTREVFAAAAGALAACGERELADSLFSFLQERLLTTPTPIAEPMLDPYISSKNTKAEANHTNDSFFLNKSRGKVQDLENKPIRFRIPNIYLFTLRKNTRGVDWVANHEWVMSEHELGAAGPKSSRDTEHGDPRFYSNVQYLLYAYEKQVRHSTYASADELTAAVAKVEELFASDEITDADRAAVNWEDYTVEVLAKLAALSDATPEVVAGQMEAMCDTHELRPVPAMYRSVFDSFMNVSAKTEDDAVRKSLRAYMGELRKTKQTLDLLVHRSYMKACVHLDNREAHNYFVKNVLRAFPWTNDDVALLLLEYRAIGDDGDAALQKKHCERVEAWCGRYNVPMSEANKQFIEDDYDRIQVQVRTKEELLTWKMKRQNELRNSLTPNLPNPVMDRITHTLKESDHADPAHLDNWVVPYSNAGRSFKWSYDAPHQPDSSSTRDLTDLDRVRYLPQGTLQSDWVSRDKWNPTSRYRPERTHEKLNINRWLEETNKSFPGQ
eukprot:TRINITY_DN22189_c0_g1_i1.p1 TRINITY_DN22189_c0_g1~~TRINITY_DN22189_c0_g1_i1.p1  ORF type:complete len:709 (+),score=252.39 TRINITY_DN22189_c0_g1_i1:74-2200(+)